MLTTHEEIEGELLNFYGNLTGTVQHTINDIDINAMRRGKQITVE